MSEAVYQDKRANGESDISAKESTNDPVELEKIPEDGPPHHTVKTNWAYYDWMKFPTVYT